MTGRQQPRTRGPCRERRRYLVALVGIVRWAALVLLLIPAPARLAAQDETALADRALLLAAAAGRLEESRFALERGADVNARGPGRETPLILASTAASGDLVALLLAAGADPTAVTDDGWSALHTAAFGGFARIARQLIAAGAPLELRETDDGDTALLLAARSGSQGVAAALLEAGADITARDRRNGNTALINAAFDPLTVTTLAELIDRGAGLDDQARGDGLSALMAAASRANLPGAELLLAAGADPELANHNGYRALHLAASLGSVDLVERLMAQGADPEAAAPDGETPLGAAADNGELAVVRLLIERGADPRKTGKKGRPALHRATIGGHSPVVLELLSRGVDANQRVPANGNTALMLAANRGFLDILRLLLANGADPNLAAADGWTALEAARMFGDEAAAALLRAAGAQR